MKSTNINKIIYDIKYSALHNYKLIILFLVLLPILIVFNTKFWVNYSGAQGVELCLADCFSLTSQPRFFSLAVVVVSAYLSQHLVKYDFMVNFVLLKKSRSKLWTDQAIKLAVISFLTALYLTVTVFAIGMIFSKEIMNWNLKDSFFYIVTQQNIQTNIWEVVGAFFLTTFLTILAIDLFLLLFKWFFRNVLIGWIILIFVILCDMSFFSLYFDKISVMFSQWVLHQNIFAILFYPMLLLFMINITAFLLARKKDFFGENH